MGAAGAEVGMEGRSLVIEIGVAVKELGERSMGGGAAGRGEVAPDEERRLLTAGAIDMSCW